MADVDRLLHLVEQSLPLGKNEWERLAVTFNSGRARGSPGRDFESLQRKFKVLYSTRKPTGMPNIPPHILKAKELKQATDEKADTVEMDDEADRDQRCVEPDFSFEADPDDSFFEEDDGEGVHLDQDTNEPAIDDSAVTDSLVAGASVAPSHTSTLSEFQELLASPLVSEGLETFARNPRPELLRADRTTYTSVSAAGFSKPLGCRETAPTTRSRNTRTSPTAWGGNLADFRDTIGAKRALEDDKETLEASYAKAKRIMAARATTALKTKLDGLENAANNMGVSFMETILLLRKENERKSEARRAEGEQCRRDDVAAREARLLSDKAEAEERRRQDKLDMEERARRDPEEARARTQELMLMIQAFTKKS
ncbi:unnamed protein product [Phytophthora fragariaefolia]|uniref:Unnamed protein product n=1 Tax=Phytophthora fragariaefolia TaxID=1490495 RepID=A0A9W7CQR6_9STRA|nr:unnamed protein product [Phytophthora fragariaefolia]